MTEQTVLTVTEAVKAELKRFKEQQESAFQRFESAIMESIRGLESGMIGGYSVNIVFRGNEANHEA